MLLSRTVPEPKLQLDILFHSTLVLLFPVFAQVRLIAVRLYVVAVNDDGGFGVY